MDKPRMKAFTKLDTYVKSYKALVDKNNMNLSPAIVSALEKVDANKDLAKHGALVVAAEAAITKWNVAWREETKKVSREKRGARSDFATEVFRMMEALHWDAPKTSEASKTYWNDDRAIAELSKKQFMNLGTYAKSYKDLVAKHGMKQSEAIVSALEKVDANKDLAKLGALVDAAAAVFTKWNAAWREETKKAGEAKQKKARSDFATEVFRMMEALHGDAPQHRDGLMKAGQKTSPSAAPAASETYKKTTHGDDLLKARQKVPLGAVSALWNLDEAKTPEETKVLTKIALDALMTEAAEIDAVVKRTKTLEHKLKISEYGIAVRKLFATVTNLAK